MTEIEVSINTKRARIRVSGHSSHDICVAISALTNALTEYSERFGEKYAPAVRAETGRYEYGAVEVTVSFGNIVYFNAYLQGIECILACFKLYEENYPEEIKYVDAHKNSNDL